MIRADSKRITIFLDADDTILESSKTVIAILNERYNITPPKNITHMKEWNYRSICKHVTGKEVDEIYSSDEFFERVTINPDFLKIYERYKEKFNFCVVTKGTKQNLEKKRQYLKERLPDIVFTGISFTTEDSTDFDKSKIDMSRGIQIDDRMDCLNTNANCKILLKNNLNVPWNAYGGEDVGNLYIVNNWDEIERIFQFSQQFPDWIQLPESAEENER